MSKQVAPWPHSQERQIVDTASKYGGSIGADAVNKVLNELKDIIFGDGTTVEAHAQTWTENVGRLKNVQSGIDSIVSQRVDTYWTGEGAEALKEWIRKFDKSLSEARTAMGKMSTALMGFSEVIVKQYGAAIELVSRIASALVSATGNVLNHITPGGMIGEVMQILADLIDEAGQIIRQLIHNAWQHRDTINEANKSVEDALISLPKPPGYIGAHESWETRTVG